MDVDEAKDVLQAELNKYTSLDYAALSALVTKASVKFEVKLENDNWYELDIKVSRNREAKGAFKVSGTIDNVGWRSYVPITKSILVVPGGNESDE